MRPSTFLRILLLAAAGSAAAASRAQVFDFTAAYFDGAAQGALTIDGLNFAWAAAVSPDGEHVYVCSGVANIASGDEDDNAVGVFARAAMTGALTFVEALFDDQDGGAADGLFSCRDVEVSPDGKQVYTGGSSDATIGVFARDAATGKLTFLSSVKDGVGGVDGIAGVEDLVLTPDGKHLYAAGRADDAVAAFERDATTGALTFVEREKNGLGGVTGLDRPLALDVSPDGMHLYVASGSNANFAGSDALTLFTRDAATGALTFVEAYVEGAAQGAATIDGIDQVSDVKVSPDGKHVYAAAEVDTLAGPRGNGNDWIARFDRDAATGKLTWKERIAGFKICPTSPFGADAESFMVFGSEGIRLYVLKNWADNGVAAFRRDPMTGALTFLDGACELDPDPIGLSLPRKLGISPLGEDLYVPGNASDALAAFTVCMGGVTVLDLSNAGLVNASKAEAACDTILAGGTPTGYTVGPAGVVAFTAPRILIASDFTVEGEFSAANAVP